MESTIIHVGYHKSASTFLQQQIFPFLPINYVFFAGDKRQYLDMIESEDGLDPDAIRAWLDDEISRKYKEGRRSITLLSHEELSGHPHGYRNISPFTTAKNLKSVFPDAKILVIVRNQLDYITSLYTYRVAIKGYETRSFARFLNEEGEKGLFDHLEYHGLIEFYHQIFGPEKVAVLPLELLLAKPEMFYHRLFEFLEVPPQDFKNARPSNVSTKRLAILDFWRPINYLFGQILNLLRLVLGKRPGNFPRFRSSFYALKRTLTGVLNKLLARSKQLEILESSGFAPVVERFAESNHRLNRLLNTDLALLGYPVKNP